MHLNWFFPCLPNDITEPPTLYSLLESIVNYDEENKVKFKNLAKEGRHVIFDFEYPLSTHITKEDFEVMILNKFLMRRIGYETLTAFKIALSVKLNEIMPNYNKLFDAIADWDLFQDGEVETRVNEESNTSTTSTTSTNSGTEDLRYSNTPQNRLTDVQNGNYVTDYNYNTSSATGTTSGEVEGTNNLDETITRTPSSKIEVYKNFIESKNNIYTMIFNDLETLFYGLV
jgi:hypothetical protein